MSIRHHYAVLDENGVVVRRGWTTAQLLPEKARLLASPLGKVARERAGGRGPRLYVGRARLGQRIPRGDED